MFGYIFYILLAGRLFTVPEKKYVTLTEVGRSNERLSGVGNHSN